MSIFIDRGTTLIVQGITGRDGGFHTKQMMEYGTRVVGGVTPGKGGQKFENTVPVFNTVHEAVAQTGANTSVIYVPPMYAADAIMEAADAGIKFIRRHHRGRPRARHDARPSLREGEGGATARAQTARG
jgi:succinyl-CoA synthetase alpha subunit